MIGDEPVADVKTCNEKYEFCDSHYMGLTEPNLVGDCPKDCPVCKDYKCYPLAPTDLFCPEDYQYCSWESKDGGWIPKQDDCRSTKEVYLEQKMYLSFKSVNRLNRTASLGLNVQKNPPY